MYELSELPSGQWLLKGPIKVQVGSFRSMIRLAIAECRIEASQLDVAVQEMIKNEHNTAHFGVWGTLIYTYNKKFSDRKVG
jgi:hypothetical protein